MALRPRIRIATPVLAVTLAATVLLGGGASAAPSPVDLGTAESFAVLGGTTVTNTGPSVITGDLGVSPGSAVTGFPPGIVSPPGTVHAADAVANQAQAGLTIAYNAAAALPCDADLTGQDLGGLTLTPGVYCFSSSAQLTGVLTLNGLGDPEADFVFKTGSTLVTASGSTVVLVNQAQPCRVFYQVGSSATLGTNSNFVGTIMALTSITATTGTSVQGRLLARNGAVTLDSNTVTRPACLPPVTTSTTPATTSTTAAAPATTTPITTVTPTTVTPTTRTTISTITAATIPGPGSRPTTTVKPPALLTSTLATTGGPFAVLVAAALLAMVAGATMRTAARPVYSNR